tara:strand:+ start:285 stop:548 length:264 start_codon:yes stop_codon:yes gene_type:complete
MLQLNDADHTLIDLSKQNLTGISYWRGIHLAVKFNLEDVEIETEFEYNSIEEARLDYQMLLDMVKGKPTFLQEEVYALKPKIKLKKT